MTRMYNVLLPITVAVHADCLIFDNALNTFKRNVLSWGDNIFQLPALIFKEIISYKLGIL